MIKDIQKIVDFTNSQCFNMAYKPILVESYSGMATHPTGIYVDEEKLYIQYREIPLKDIISIEYGYFSDKHKDRLEKVYVESIEDVKNYIIHKRYQNLEDIYGMSSYYSYFPFYEVDKIGCGYVFIETKAERYEIFYPTRKITCEKREEDNKDDSNKQGTKE